MKKKKNRILSVSGAALCLFFPVLLAACSQEDALPRPLEVSAEVGNPATRATDAHADDYDKREFVAGDVIRITDGTKTADYQRVVTGTTGTWQPASGQTALTTTGSETFTASYPTAFTRILTDQRTATNFWKSNRLTATGVLDGSVIFRLSSGVTAIKRSASLMPTSFSPDMDEGEAVTVIRSKLELSVLSFSSSSSIRMMSCFSRESNLAKWVPTAPAPAIIIFIVIANCGSIAYWGIKNG